MKIFLTTALVASLSIPAFAGDQAKDTTAQVETKSTKEQPVEAHYPEEIRSQVLLGGLNENHKKFILEQQRQRDLYN